MARAGKEKPGIIDADGKIRDLSQDRERHRRRDARLRRPGQDQEGQHRKRLKPVARQAAARRLRRPSVGNFIAIGLNYADHAAEAGMPIPTEPIIFNKAPTCICGPNDNTIIPKESSKLD